MKQPACRSFRRPACRPRQPPLFASAAAIASPLPLLLLLLLAALCTAGAARADQPLWEVGVGAAVLRLPHYRGAEQAHTWLLPVPYAVYRGDIFKSDEDGTRARLFSSERIDLNLSLDASAPTRSRDNQARSGMADLPPTVEIGPNLNLNLARSGALKLDLRLPLRAVFAVRSRSPAVGYSFAPRLNLDWRIHGWNLGLQAGPQWGSRERHALFYDVAPGDATALRPAYTARGGFAGWDSTVALSRRSGNRWTAFYVTADSLSSATFATSPLVKQRSSVSAGVAVAWVLKASTQRVPGGD